MNNQNERKLINWNCEKCNIRIGVVDPEAKQLRIRYKDLVLTWGWCAEASAKDDKITILCRRCAWQNEKTRVALTQTVLPTPEKSSHNDDS